MTSSLARKLAILAAGSAAVCYLTFRVGFTVNLESYYSIVASLLLLSAEAWGIGLMFLYFLQVWDTREPEKAAVVPGKTVDVFLPTYNEDAELLRGSINALNQLDYPHTTYVLDDGRRESVKKLCEEMGVEYISRDNNLHAKAGNLNNALDRTNGEFVIIFDADHIARPHFISRLIGYFEDPKLAFIQTPHAFYNFDNFQAHVDYKKGVYWEEGQLFYNVIQPGKNCWNANVFCGSAAMFRRSALEEVGLIATETITEDMHTGLRIHSKGWKSLFVNERMISAQAAPDITTFISQRLRWGEGNLSIFAYDNPLTLPGLTLAQRLNYLGSMLGWTTGPAKLMLYAAPIMMLFSGVSPVGEFSWLLGVITVAYLICTWMAVKIVSDGYGRLWDIEVQAMTNFWVQCQCLYRSIVHRGRGKFVVTSKRGRQSKSIFSLILPHIVLISVGIAAITWASAKIFLGVSADYLGLAVGGTLIGLQSIMAFQVVRKALRPSDGRFSWRHPTSDIHVRYDSREIAGQAISLDINETGIGLIAYHPMTKGDRLDLTLTTAEQEVTCLGEVRHCTPFNGLGVGQKAYRVGVHFEDLTTDQLNAIWTIASNVAVVKQYERMAKTNAEKKEDRLGYRLPVEVFSADGSTLELSAVSTKLEPQAIYFETSQPLTANRDVRFEIDCFAGTVSGGGYLSSTNKPGRYQLEFRSFQDQSRSILKSVLTAQRGDHVQRVVNPVPKKAAWPVIEPALKCGWLSLAASVLCMAGAWYVWEDQYFLSHIARQEELTSEQLAKADELLDKIVAEPNQLFTTTEMLDARKVLETMGDTNRLVKLEDRLLLQHPEDVGLKLSRANRALATKDFDGAAKSFEALTAMVHEANIKATKDQRFEAKAGLARSLVGLGDVSGAIDAYQLALDEKKDPQAALEVANLLVDQKDFAQIQELLAILPNGFESRLIEARLDVANGLLEKAEQALFELTVEDPANHLVRQTYAETLAVNDKTDSAIDQFKTLINSEYEVENLRKRTADLLIRDERFAEAVPILDQLAVDMVQDEEFWVTYVTAIRRAGTLSPTAAGTIEEIYRQLLETPEASIQLKVELAEHFAKHDDSFKAVKLLALCTDQQPNNLSIRKRYAEVLHDAGRFDEADQQYQLLLTPAKQQAKKKQELKANPVEPLPVRRPVVSLASGLR
ncbi:glycosyltransferase [Bremerella sp. T1]|uniref:glycosyltransferase n=1 Tax=Bremerella sp. TYQ1 TaxID=3119568 RepID=UPI001CCFDDC2|nr:glycosyltransferase [Bremerella volcania]UBM33826.1 glycosyltransferase [Bremerella volcania]